MQGADQVARVPAGTIGAPRRRMLRPLSVEQPAHDPTLAAARVVESAVQLARAEARLAFAHARAALVKTVGAVLAVMIAAAAAQVALLLVALSPVLLAARQPLAVFAALVPSLCLTGLGAWRAFVAWRGLASDSEPERLGH
jgi:hypothetical protein